MIEDGFYFVLNIPRDLVSIISIDNKTDTVAYHGTSEKATIEEFEKSMKDNYIGLLTPKYKLGNKIEIQKFNKVR